MHDKSALRRQIKQHAKASLQGNMSKAMGLFVINILVSVILFVVMFKYMDMLPKSDNILTPLSYVKYYSLSILLSIFIIPLYFGMLKWYYLIINRQSPSVTSVFEGYAEAKTIAKSVGVYFFIQVLILLWVFLVEIIAAIAGVVAIFIASLAGMAGSVSKGAIASGAMTGMAPGIIAVLIILVVAFILYIIAFVLRYMPSYYIYVSKPQMRIRDIVRQSVVSYRGHYIEGLLFFLSFFGWILLCIITAGIAAFYVVPYMGAASATYFYYIINNRLPGQEKPQIIISEKIEGDISDGSGI